MANQMPQNDAATSSRRDFLKSSATAVAGAALATGLTGVTNVHAAGSDLIRVGLIGCGSRHGGRGRGAAQNCVQAAPGVKLVAMGDLFRDHLEYTRNNLNRLGPDRRVLRRVGAAETFGD